MTFSEFAEDCPANCTCQGAHHREHLWRNPQTAAEVVFLCALAHEVIAPWQESHPGAPAQWRRHQGEAVQAVVEVLAEGLEPWPPSCWLCWSRRSHQERLCAWDPVPPRREKVPSCNTCSSLACSAGGISPISSRNIVPRRIAQTCRACSLSAPVNAPCS